MKGRKQPITDPHGVGHIEDKHPVSAERELPRH
jgi:hypothetical protein